MALLTPKEYRKRAGLTLAEVADHLHTTKGAVCQWENGFSVPKVKRVFKLAKLYSCSAEDLCKSIIKVRYSLSKGVKA